MITLGDHVNREMRDYGQETGFDLGRNPTNSALAIFPGGLIIVPPLVSYSRGTKRAQAAERVAGVPPLSGWIALILFLLLSIAYPPYIQSELNKIWRRVGTAVSGGSLPQTPDEMPPRLEDPPPGS